MSSARRPSAGIGTLSLIVLQQPYFGLSSIESGLPCFAKYLQKSLPEVIHNLRYALLS